MANVTITTNSNHDDLVARLAGEDITINNGAICTIDSQPHSTGRGILGDIQINDGELHIDGRYVRRITYNTGSGALPAVGQALTYGTSGTAKIINFESGNNVAGVLQITIQGVLEEPAGVITGGGWSATITESRIGFLRVFGEDQVWDAVNALATLRITGDWFELGIGTGADNQSLTLPHAGAQHALWIETGAGTNVFEIWHRSTTPVSSVFFNGTAQWGPSQETGHVFTHSPGTSTVNFGTSVNGGAPESGARIRIPNVHMSTTTVAAPTTEYAGGTPAITTFLEIVDASVTENVFIDHLNASTVVVSLSQTNGAIISDSAIGMWASGGFIVRNNSPVVLTNCAFVSGTSLSGDLPALQLIITDNTGGVEIEDCVIYAGINATLSAALNLTTMANLTLRGTNKFVSNIQDENTSVAFYGTTALNVLNEGTLIILNGGVQTVVGCSNWDLGDMAFGQLTARGATEDSLNLFSLTATTDFRVRSGRYVTGGGTRGFAGGQFVLNDSSRCIFENFGSVSAKLANGSRGTSLFNLAGISSDITFRRVFFTGLNTAQAVTILNSCAGVVIENCSSDYVDEIELDGNRVDVRGLHAASGAVATATGVDGTLVNVSSTVFLDYFKSDTTGAIGLLFSPPGTRYASNVTILSGTPVWDGNGALRLRAVGDEVEFLFPYKIRGHTAFQNVALQLAGVNTGNLTYQYDLDTGSGFSGTFKTINGANLSPETLPASGLGIKIRIRCATAATTNTLTGFAILTNTTLAAQEANYYPNVVTTLTLTGLQAPSEVRIYEAGTTNEVAGVENSGTSESFQIFVPSVDIVVHSLNYEYLRVPGVDTSVNATVPIQQRFDRNYANP